MTTNPFEYRKPITNPARFFGRQSELIRIRDSCYKLGSISIVGERRAGKSSLLKLFAGAEMMQEFGFGPEYIFCFNDLEGSEDSEPAQFWKWVLSKLANKLPEESLRAEIESVIVTKAFDNDSLRDLFETLFLIKQSKFLFDSRKQRAFLFLIPVFRQEIDA